MIELLITIALTVALLTVAVISVQRWIDRDELYKTSDTLIDVLDFARTEAMATHALVSVCPLGVDGKCGDDWSAGQIVSRMSDNRVLRVEDAAPEEYYLLWVPALQEFPEVVFQADGFVRNGLQGSFYVCAKSDNLLSSRIVLLRTGRTRALVGHFPDCDS